MKREVGIFSFGYWGWGNRVPELRRRFLEYNKRTRGRGIVWVDIRIQRNVRAKGFRGRNVENSLGKQNYEWLRYFGNVLVGEGAIRIWSYRQGLEQLHGIVKKASKANNDLILFCACKPDTRCHRFTVMNWLRQRTIRGAKVYGEFPADIQP